LIGHAQSQVVDCERILDELVGGYRMRGVRTSLR
jgi:hypothetical protein